MEQVSYVHPNGRQYRQPFDPEKAGDPPADYDQPIFAGRCCWNCRKPLKGTTMFWWTLTGCPLCHHSFCD